MEYLYIKADYSTYKIAVSDILFIEGLDDYLKIHLENTKPIVARMTMKSMTEKLPSRDFIRVHRSFIAVSYTHLDVYKRQCLFFLFCISLIIIF